MMPYSVEPRTRKYVEEYGFLSFARKYEKQLLDTRLDSLKTASKKVVQNAGEFIGNKIADTVTKSNDDSTEKQEPVKEIIIPPEKRDKIFNTLRKVLQKGNTTKYLNYERFSCIKICDKKWIEVNDLSSGQYFVSKNIRSKTSMLRSELCDYNDAYIVVKETIDLLAAVAN